MCGLQAEKEKLLSEGFQDWNKRDFTNYVRACEKCPHHDQEI